MHTYGEDIPSIPHLSYFKAFEANDVSNQQLDVCFHDKSDEPLLYNQPIEFLPDPATILEGVIDFAYHCLMNEKRMKHAGASLDEYKDQRLKYHYHNQKTNKKAKVLDIVHSIKPKPCKLI